MLIIFLYKILQKYNSEMMESFLHLSIPAHYIRLVLNCSPLSFNYCPLFIALVHHTQTIYDYIVKFHHNSSYNCLIDQTYLLCDQIYNP